MSARIKFPGVFIFILVVFFLSAGSSVAIPKPLNPSGKIVDKTPTFSWTKVTGATSYRYQLLRGTKVIYTKTILPNACKATGVCSNTPTTLLTPGIYKWRVAAYIGGAWKPYSGYKTFTLLGPGVKILNSSTYASSLFRYVVGEVFNNTPYSLWLVKISVNFYDNGQLVATDHTYVDLNHFQPYEKTCFRITLSNDPPSWTSYSFEPISYYKVSAKRPKLTITDDSGWEGEYFYEILGQVRNDDMQTAKSVLVVATLYDATNKVIGCDSGYTNNTTLVPGQVSSFDISSYSLFDPLNVATYSLQVDGSY